MTVAAPTIQPLTVLLRFGTAAAFCMIFLAGCAEPAPPPPPPPEVAIVTVQTQPLTNVIEVPGRLQAVRTAEVRARVDGIVQRRLYEEGTDVRAGQVLFEIDSRPLRAQLSAAEATLARAEATAANAAQDIKRYTGLVAQKALSQQEYDAAVSRERTAQADVAQARAQVETARLNLAYATVRAPIAGRAGRAEVTEGAMVNAGSGTLLTRIEQVDPIYVNFAQSSSQLLALREQISSGALNLSGLDRIPVHIVLGDGRVYSHTGHVDFLDLRIDEATGTAALRAEVPNPDRVLLPGQFVRARLEAGVQSHGLLIPQRAVTMTPDGASVMIVGEKNLAESRSVTVGALQGGSWQILEGLAAGERVIVDGLQKVQPGQPVQVAANAPRPDTHPVAAVADSGARVPQ